MKKLVLFLLLAWFAIYAGNHVLFVSTPKDIDTALASQKSDLDTQARKIDSWVSYLPGVGVKRITAEQIEGRRRSGS
jgi:hypothetical protein